jgi:hypothetical protein
MWLASISSGPRIAAFQIIVASRRATEEAYNVSHVDQSLQSLVEGIQCHCALSKCQIVGIQHKTHYVRMIARL